MKTCKMKEAQSVTIIAVHRKHTPPSVWEWLAKEAQVPVGHPLIHLVRGSCEHWRYRALVAETTLANMGMSSEAAMGGSNIVNLIGVGTGPYCS